MAGLLVRSGYFAGSTLLEPTAANPKGYFEDVEVNSINEALLAPAMRRRPRIAPLRRVLYRPGQYQRWLAVLPPGRVVRADASLERRMRAATGTHPFCLKDPRFSYTLDAWRPMLGNAGFICVFRDPRATVRSILNECRRDPHLHTIHMTERRAEKVWVSMYRWILEVHRSAGDWVFVEYDQLLDGSALGRVEDLVQARVEGGFADRSLERSPTDVQVSTTALDLYAHLRELARSDDA